MVIGATPSAELIDLPPKICYTVNMTYYESILTQNMLQTQFVELGKTSRQIAREFKASRKVINTLLLKYGFISKRDLEPGDLP